MDDGPSGLDTAPNIDNLFMFISAVNTFFYALVIFLIIVFVKRYRRRSENEITPHITHNNALEIAWSVIPLIILIGIFFWGFHGYVKAQIAPANAIEIQVTGKKWVWPFEYPGRNANVERFPRSGEPSRPPGDEHGRRDSQLLRSGLPD